MSAREVIARALCKHRNKDSVVGYCVGVPGDDCAGDCAHFEHTDELLAALDAAGPSEAMQQAGVNAMAALGYVGANESEVVVIWRAMLAAAKEAEMAKRFAEERYDQHGPIRLMVQADGYRMVRRPGAAPFVMTDREWSALYMEPVQSPCGSFHCKGACQHIRDKGEPCTPAREKARPAAVEQAAKEPPNA